MDLSDLNPVFSSRLDAFKGALDKAGIGYSIVSGYRSPEQQAQLYANGQARRAKQPLPYPNEEAPLVVAPAWRSFHNYGLAADFHLTNPNDYSRLAQIAPQFGLTGIGASDPGHIQMAGTLADNINQYKLAGWRPSGQPTPEQGAVAYTGGPPAGQPPTAVAARGTGGSLIEDLARIESNNRNIFSTVDKDYPGQAGSRSQGYFQIDTPTWQQFAKNVPGASQYANAMSAPRDVQAQVASLIPLSRFGSRTQRMLTQDFGQLDPSKTIGQLASSVPGTTLNTSGGPTAVAGGPSAPAAPGQPGQGQGGLAGSLPGFTANSPGAQMTSAGLKQLAGGQGAGGGGGGTGGDEDKPPPPSPMLGGAPMASGGPMMLSEGGQNTFGQRAAMNALAQQGFLMQPSLAAYTMGGLTPPVPSTIQSTIQPMAAGQASGMPGLPGTTLNSPSQLQMALMTGAMNPYDLYSGMYGGTQGQGSM